MRIRNVKRKLLYLVVITIVILFTGFVVGCLSIGSAVKERCQVAKSQYSGDCVGALTALLNDQSKDFRSRNSAIWALGQLGDSKALPVLKSYYTGNIPPRESLDNSLSQYELKKAINLASGGFNLTSLILHPGHAE